MIHLKAYQSTPDSWCPTADGIFGKKNTNTCVLECFKHLFCTVTAQLNRKSLVHDGEKENLKHFQNSGVERCHRRNGVKMTVYASV